MAGQTKRYRDLVQRVTELESSLLDFPATSSPAVFSPGQLDMTRSFIVLVHAEIEAFCEEIAVRRVTRAVSDFKRTNKVGPTLRRVLDLYRFKKNELWIDPANAPLDVVESAERSFKGSVESNHGIKESNLGWLLYPLGLDQSILPAGWLLSMSSYGSDRGTIAHKSVKAQQPPNPIDERAKVKALLVGLAVIDRRSR